MQHHLLTALAILMVMSGSAQAAKKGEKTSPAKIDLVGMDYPDYVEIIGALSLPDIAPEVLTATEAQYLRLSLVDVEDVPYLATGYVIYQTLTTEAVIPVNINFIVDKDENAWCFNPEIPYCTDFSQLNTWLRKAHVKVSNKKEAGSLARYVIALGMSTVHHPQDFLFLRLSGKFGVEHFEFLKNIEDIYVPGKANFRSEAEQSEYDSIIRSYEKRINRPTTEPHGKGWRLHGFTYKIMRGSGDLREWNIDVHPNGTVKVKMTALETGIGEISWSWAP